MSICSRGGTLLLLGTLCLAGVFLVLIQGQSPSDESPILLLDQAVETTLSGARLPVELVNQSSKSIRGYVVLAVFRDSRGETIGFRTQTRVHPPHLPHHGHSFEPGRSWMEEVAIPLENGNPVRHTLTVDYVLFEDGTSWGADSQRQSLKIQGVLSGFQSERARLRRLLSESGTQAVIEDLEQTQ
jgi:hypothetical protein